MAESKTFFGDKALLLSRVSTPEQHFEGFSPQQNDLKLWAKEIGYTELVSIDTIESGFLDFDSKKGWNAIIKFLEEHKDYRTVIATEINRIARDEAVLMEVKKYLMDNKIQLIIKDLKFWLLNPDGSKSFSADLLFNIYTSMAHFEMLDKKERLQRALRDYRREGYSIGGKELFGYDRIPDASKRNKLTYKINDDEKWQIEQVYKWYAYGINGDLSITSLKRIRLECIQDSRFDKYFHSQRNLNKCLKEKAYTGIKETHNKMKNPQYWNYGDKTAPKYIDANSYVCVYPQLIDKDLFLKVQERLSKRDPHKRAVSNNKYVDISHKHVTLLSKIAVCPICGGFLTGDYRIKDGQNKHTYRCAKSRRNIEDCSYRKAPSMLSLDSAVWSFLRTKVTEIIAKKNAQYAAIKQEDVYNRIKKLEEELMLIDEDYDDAEYIYNQNKRRNRASAREKYQKRLNEIDKKKSVIEKVINRNKRLLKELDERNTEGRREKELEEKILRITNTKEEIYKYIHLLIKTVKPLLTNKTYTVLEVITFDNTDEVFDYGKEDTLGLPVIKGLKHDNLYYICLNKRDNHRVMSRLIINNTTYWITDGEYFQVLGDTRHYSVEDVFALNPDEQDPAKYCGMTRGFEEIEYIPLSVYEEDKHVSADT